MSAAVASAIQLRDVCVFGGLGATCYGVAQYSVPIAFIVGGVALVGIGLWAR